MPVEQGTVVAIVALAGSFLTVLVTGAVNIWSKWIESEQKVKEHKLSIRSVYVTKKIDAGQLLIIRNSDKIKVHSYIFQFYYHLLTESYIVNNLLNILMVSLKENEDVKYENITDLYYDVSKYDDKISEYTNKVNHCIGKINEYFDKENITTGYCTLNKDMVKIITDLIDYNSVVIETHNEMSKYVRSELSKYDMI